MQGLNGGHGRGTNQFKRIGILVVLTLGIGGSAIWWASNNLPEKIFPVTATSALASAPGRAISTVISIPATPVPPE